VKSMATHRIAIIGAGSMARHRGQALLDTGRAQVCAVASRRFGPALDCAERLGCDTAFDDYRQIAQTKPDAVLIEVPHLPQDEITLWALTSGYDVFVGGSLAVNSQIGAKIVELAADNGCLVEAGFQRRYDAAWEEIHRLVQSRELGDPIMAVTMALWLAPAGSWYADQHVSGGMPLTHMSYCYLNAMRWILGAPTVVSAMASPGVSRETGRVQEETCAALIGFDSGAFLSATASYIRPENMTDAEPRFICSAGGMQVDGDTLTVFRGGEIETRSFDAEPSSFVRQAHAFLDAIESRAAARNPPEDALLDVRLAEAIALSVREQRTVTL
jgi:myo-inositol 2-dehydrogenase/D-chiro-inositol 1-dehydrogenase